VTKELVANVRDAQLPEIRERQQPYCSKNLALFFPLQNVSCRLL
jgi:hypothetical protein